MSKHSRADEADKESNKRPRVGDGNTWRSNPKEVLRTMAMPSSINEWGRLQQKIWEGHPPLPKGWIRIWSKSRDQ
eukprot:5371411-Amphidinium_carterae.1